MVLKHLSPRLFVTGGMESMRKSGKGIASDAEWQNLVELKKRERGSKILLGKKIDNIENVVGGQKLLSLKFEYPLLLGCK